MEVTITDSRLDARGDSTQRRKDNVSTARTAATAGYREDAIAGRFEKVLTEPQVTKDEKHHHNHADDIKNVRRHTASFLAAGHETVPAALASVYRKLSARNLASISAANSKHLIGNCPNFRIGCA